MRLRKPVLLYSQNLQAGSCLAFVLNVRPNFVVRHVDSKIRYLAALKSDIAWEAAVILAFGDLERTSDLVTLAGRKAIPTMVLAYSNEFPSEAVASVSLPFGASNAEVIERLKLITVRKRGPKPGSRQAAVLEVA